MENNLKFTVVIGVLNQFDLTTEVIKKAVANLTRPEEVGFLIIDNGSTENYSQHFFSLPDAHDIVSKLGNFDIVRNDENTGNYPLFRQALQFAKTDIIGFIHSDLFIHESGWDNLVIDAFQSNPEYGLMGFIGSTEIDNFGGRGSGTCSGFAGKMVKGPNGQEWIGSPAEAHGRKVGWEPYGSVVDGCVMIFKRSVLESLEYLDGFPLHHFYDRIMSVQVIEAGYKIGILGVECDHISGQTANQESTYVESARQWCKKHLNIDEPQQWVDLNRAWFESTSNPSRGHSPNGWDHVLYLEAERRFLQVYRDVKRLVPMINGKKI